MDTLQKNKTWELVNLLSGKKPVGCKWVFAVKFKNDGSLERYKARLVAKGYILRHMEWIIKKHFLQRQR